MYKRASLIFLILLLLTTLVESLHYHDDGADHPECSICVATHQQADTGYTAPVYEILNQSAETLYPRPVLPVVANTLFSSFNNRAPPA
jgi:hypothetical protein